MKILGDYHTHSNYSDGDSTPADAVRVAKERGLVEIAVTDHGPAKIFHKLRFDDWARVRGEIETAAAENEIKAFFGIEANLIGADGRIDVKPEARDALGVLNFGLHGMVWPANLWTLVTFFIPNYFWYILRWTPKGRIRKNTEVVKRAIQNNEIDIWTHPRLYFKLDVVEVAKVCAERGTLIELNSKRISFRPIDFERMIAVGAKFVVNSDAHSLRCIGSVDRAIEFLKYCDFKEGDVINLNGTFSKYQEVKRELHNGNKERDTKKHGRRGGKD